LGRLLATLATLLILLLGAAFLAPAFMDWNAYRPDIERVASAILGRPVHIKGDIGIALLPEPHLHAAKIGAGDEARDGATFTAEAVDLTLSLQALLGGRIEASRLKLVRPVFALDFSKPLASGGPAVEAGEIAAATVNRVEIEDGSVFVLSKARGVTEALALTNIDGSLAAAFPEGSYRFSGRISRRDRDFDVKFLVASAPDRGIKLAGSAVDFASKTVFQADGVLSAIERPVFEGSLAVTSPQRTGFIDGAPFDIQLKSAAIIDLSGAALSDLALTLDTQNRPQVFLGSANISFAAETAKIELQAPSLDADALFAASAPAAGWNGLATALDALLWLYPDFSLRLSLAAGRLQLKSEFLEAVKIDGTRASRRWVFEQVTASLPGDTAVKLAGTLTKTAGKSRLSASMAVEGKNLGRFSRWLAPPAPNAKTVSATAFAVKGSLLFSDEIVAFEGITGNFDGTPFTAGLHLDRAPVRKLQLSLAGDSFDISSIETGPIEKGALSADGLGAAWQTALAQIAPIFGGDLDGIDTADLDLTAGSIKTSFVEAKNLAVHVKFDQDLITVSRLSAETSDGLTLRGEGAIPLRAAGQGRFEGRLEARSAQAVLQVAALAGYDVEGLRGRRAEDLAPAILSISYGADAQAGAATAQLNGNLGAARLEGRAQLKGALADWRTGLLAAQVNVSAPDGNRLLAQLFPKASLTPGAPLSPGTISIRVNGTARNLETSGTIKAAQLQMQLDGATEVMAGTFAFNGKVSAVSQTPEQFLPPLILALLGGEPRANLRVDTNIVIGPGHLDAGALKAESPRNSVTGRLAVDMTGGMTRLDADLKADQLSLPSLLNYFLSPMPVDQISLSVPAAIVTSSSSSSIWSDRAFVPGAFQNTAAKVSLAAKAMKLSDAIVLSDGQVTAKLEKSRLDIQRLEGKALGGDLSSSLILEARGNAVQAITRISLTNADLSNVPNPGTPAIVTGKASLLLSASGQGLSPRGLLPVLQGRGVIALSDGQVAKLSPTAVQKSAEELLSVQLPLTEEAIAKKVLEASQSSDFKFQGFRIPLTIRDGVLEIRRASFRNREGTVRMEAYLDLTRMQADTTWQAGVSSDRRAWPPVKLQLAGPLGELGARPRTLAAEDFVRAILVHKMEGDIARLEGLNKPQGPSSSWTTTQEPAAKPNRRRKRDQDKSQSSPTAPGGAAAGKSGFETRMRDALQSGTGAPANASNQR
jgi:hypothetical protein